MMTITISQELKALGVSLGITIIDFKNQAHDEKIWEELLNPLIQEKEQETVEMIREDERNQKVRKVYKALGKDPARFRPSSESLWRRLVQQKGLYAVNDLVDLTNYFSLQYHLPMGSYDLAKAQGTISLAIGTAEDVYQGIGKAQVNVEHSLVLKDEVGAFGNSSGDSARTMITEATKKALIITYFFDQTAEEKAAIQADIAKITAEYLQDCTILAQEISE